MNNLKYVSMGIINYLKGRNYLIPTKTLKLLKKVRGYMYQIHFFSYFMTDSLKSTWEYFYALSII